TETKGMIVRTIRLPALVFIVFPAPLMLLGIAAATWAAGVSFTLDLKRPPDDSPVTVLTVIGGGEPLEWGGTRLAGGDVHGDGIADRVIAAPGGAEDRPSRRGRLYVVYGSVAPPRATLDRTMRRLATPPGAPPGYATDADVVIEGWDDFDHLGRSLAVADVDG